MDDFQHLVDFVFRGLQLLLSVVEANKGRYRVYSEKSNENNDLDVIFCCSCLNRAGK